MKRAIGSFLVCAWIVGMMSATAQEEPFPVWEQGFESSVAGWIGGDIAGPEGWCGTTEQRTADASELSASAGNAYAVVVESACNEYWQEQGFETSGPYALGAGHPAPWPAEGYVNQLDVYLDPQDPVAFTFVSSVYVFGPPDDVGNFRRFFVPVTEDDGRLQVMGRDVNERGWFTFRTTLGSDDGRLEVDFELLRRGESLLSAPLTTTLFTEEAAASLAVEDLGIGYLWFVSIAEGKELPIDEHRVVPAGGGR